MTEIELWQDFTKTTELINKKRNELSVLEARQDELAEQLRRLAAEREKKFKKLSPRYARICMAALNDLKHQEIADQFKMTRSAVSKIIKKFMPTYLELAAKGVGGMVKRTDVYKVDWDSIDEKIDKEEL